MFTFGHPNKRINEISRAARVTCAHARYVMYLFVGGVMMMMMTSRRKRTAEKTQTGV